MEIPHVENPIELFDRWYKEAQNSGLKYPDAMALATVDEDGMPANRMVLLKALDDRGFVFFTNTRSAKGEQLAARPKAALLFYWQPLDRQVRIRGTVEKVSDDEADKYFATRPRLSRLGAWASDQSKPLEDRSQLEQRLEELKEKYSDDGEVPRPPHWHGYRVVPVEMEFWREGDNRLHHRRLFRREGKKWTSQLLNP